MKSDKEAKNIARNARLESTKKFYLKIISISIAAFAIICGLWLEKSHVTQLKCLHPDLEAFFNADCCMKWSNRLRLRSNKKLIEEVENQLIGQSLVEFMLNSFYNDLKKPNQILPIHVFYGPKGTGKRQLANAIKDQLVGKRTNSRNLVDIDLDNGIDPKSNFLGIGEYLACPYRVVTIKNGQSIEFYHIKQISNYPNATIILLYENNDPSMLNLMKNAATSLYVDRSEENTESQLHALTRYIRASLYENEKSPFYRDQSYVFDNVKILPFLPLTKPDLIKILKTKNSESNKEKSVDGDLIDDKLVGKYLDKNDQSFAKFNVLNEISFE